MTHIMTKLELKMLHKQQSIMKTASQLNKFKFPWGENFHFLYRGTQQNKSTVTHKETYETCRDLESSLDVKPYSLHRNSCRKSGMNEPRL